MPPKFLFTRDQMITAALELTRAGGLSAVTARGLAAKLGCSVKPIFGLFENMEEVQREVLLAAHQCYLDKLHQSMAAGAYPPYKASGMAYIRFAREEKELFRLLFMRDRSGEKVEENLEEIQPLLDIIQKNLNISREEAIRFHLEQWIFVHGVAAMAATSYLDWDEETISGMLTDVYQGLKQRYERKE